MRCAALNSGPDFHLLDHIAPLAEWLGMPLITTEALNYELALEFYPQIAVEWMPDLEFRLQELAERFDALFECKYWQAHLKKLFSDLYQKEMRLVFCPHGQSDKGYETPLLAPYAEQDFVLLYGKLLHMMLCQDLKIQLPEHAFVGNYRLRFYQKYQPFYDSLAQKELPLKQPNRKTLLYAPTWQDADHAGSLFRFSARILSELPSDWNLLLKVHPLLSERNPAAFCRLEKELEGKENVYLIERFPPVYPILALADFYLGDASSVGYDFLFFDRPLFFLPGTRQGRLQSCGTVLDLGKSLFSQFEKPDRYQKKRKQLYELAYSSMGGKTKTVDSSLKWLTSGFTSMS